MDNFKSRGLLQSIMPTFKDDFESTETTGPVNKMQPLPEAQGVNKGVSYWDKMKGLYSKASTFGSDKGEKMSFSKSFFGRGEGSTAATETTTGTASGTYAQYFGVAAIGLAVGDFAGSVYNKRKSKRKK